MKKKQFGRTDLNVSLLTFGCDAVNKGPLPQEALAMIMDIQAGFAA